MSQDGLLQIPGTARIDVPGGLDSQSHTYIPKFGQKIFPPDGPQVEHIRQGQIGDCFLLAAIVSILLQPRGKQVILGMFKDVGSGNPQAPASVQNPDFVVVRLYDVNGNAQYAKVKKRLMVKGGSLASGGVEVQPYEDGALWVAMLEAAFSCLDDGGRWNPQTATVERYNKSATHYDPFKALLGADTKETVIFDLSEASGQQAFHGTADGAKSKFFFDVLMNEAGDSAQNRAQITMQVFNGNKVSADAFFKWLYPSVQPPPLPSRGPAPASVGRPLPPPPQPKQYPAIAEFRKEVLGRLVPHAKGTDHSKLVRYETIAEFLQKKQLDLSAQKAILDWIEKYKVLPGKRFTRLYTPQDDSVYRALQTAINSKTPAALWTRVYVGSLRPDEPDVTGFSANEAMVRGLVANHAYSVVNCTENQGRRIVTVRNPWASYGRAIVIDHNRQGHAVAQSEGTFDLQLSNVTRRFSNLQVAGMSLGLACSHY